MATLPLILILLSGFLSYIFIRKFAPLLRLFQITDSPDGIRKLHNRNIPTIGGGVFVTSFLIVTFVYYLLVTNYVPHVILILGVMIFLIIGIKDDLSSMSPLPRLWLHIVLSSLIILGMDLSIPSMFKIFGVTYLPEMVGFALSVFALVTIINAFNLIDGIDGLAGSLTLIGSVSFSFLFYVIDEPQWSVISLIYAGAIIGFLFHNVHPAKIFMGDSGSTVSGFFLGTMALIFIREAAFTDTSTIFTNSAPIIAMSILSIPLFDMLRVFIVRLKKGKSPLHPDRMHIHHILEGKGLTHTWICIYLVLLNIIIMLLSVIFAIGITNTISLGVLVSLLSFLFYMTNSINR